METTSEFGALDQILVENNPEQEHDKGTEDKKEKDIGMHDASNDELLPARAQDREDKNYKTELVKQKHDLGNVEESSAADDCLRQHQTNMERP